MDPPGPGDFPNFRVPAVAGSPALYLHKLRLYAMTSLTSAIFLPQDDIVFLPFTMILPGNPIRLFPGKVSFQPTDVRPTVMVAATSRCLDKRRVPLLGPRLGSSSWRALVKLRSLFGSHRQFCP